MGLRDPFAVDDNALRERIPRITTLLASPSQAAWARAQEYAGEYVRYFLDDLILRFNDPTLTLRFLAPGNQARVTYKIDGGKKIGGVETVVLKFQETKTKPPVYILDTPGKAIASGKVWIDPATGRIHRTELSMQSDPEYVHVIVDYAHEPGLDLWIDGGKKIGGVETVVLKFQETKTKPPVYILDTPGKAIASGRVWIDPATGRIHRTELSMQSDPEYVHVIVDYAHEPGLDLWLPSAMTHTVEATERTGTGMNNMGSGTPGIGRRSFDCRAAYSNVRVTPIDLRATK